MRSFKLKILGKNVDVNFVEPTRFDKGTYGEADTRGCKIWLSTEGTKESKAITLLHEIIHFVCDDFMVDLDESQIQPLAQALFIVMQENGIDLTRLVGGTRRGGKDGREF
jgi:hypothetical protein